MNTDKQLPSNPTAYHGVTSSDSIGPWLDIEDDDEILLSEQRLRIRTIVGRALTVYLILFFGLGLLMSLLGVDPLANQGLMPKALLLFVGLSLLIALLNVLTDLSHERGLSWLVRGLATNSSSARKENSGAHVESTTRPG